MLFLFGLTYSTITFTTFQLYSPVYASVLGNIIRTLYSNHMDRLFTLDAWRIYQSHEIYSPCVLLVHSTEPESLVTYQW